jgi:ubiquinone/menaquinone biosynthesis C-methylase UbiE
MAGWLSKIMEIKLCSGSITYKFLSKFYDLFDLIFLFGGKGNPRFGLLEVIGNTPHSILDICTGTAASSLLLASHNTQNQILGIDISDDMLGVAYRKITQKKLINLKVENMSATAMGFPDDSFDVVMVSFALHEFENDLRENVCKEISRVLKPGGQFLIIDFARQSSRLNQMFLKAWGLIEPASFNDFLNIDWRTQLKDYGLEFESEREYSFSKLYLFYK